MMMWIGKQNKEIYLYAFIHFFLFLNVAKHILLISPPIVNNSVTLAGKSDNLRKNPSELTIRRQSWSFANYHLSSEFKEAFKVD